MILGTLEMEQDVCKLQECLALDSIARNLAGNEKTMWANRSLIVLYSLYKAPCSVLRATKYKVLINLKMCHYQTAWV